MLDPILIVIQGLDDLVNALKKFSEISWSEIGCGLTAMGGALGEVALFSGALGTIFGDHNLLQMVAYSEVELCMD